MVAAMRSRRKSISCQHGALIAVLAILGTSCGNKSKASPPARGERWAQVERWARPNGAPKRGPQLAELLQPLSPITDEIDWYAAEERRDTTLPSELRTAVDALHGWVAEGAPVAETDCEDPGKAIGPWGLVSVAAAQAALLLAPDDAEHPRVVTALTLGHRLVSAGDNLLQVTVGAAILKANAEWLHERGVAPSVLHREFAPGPNALRRAYAAEAICSVQMASSMSPTGSPVTAAEVESLRAFQEDLVHALDGQSGPDVTEKMRRTMASSPYRNTRLARNIGAAPANVAQRIQEDLEYYREAVR